MKKEILFFRKGYRIDFNGRPINPRGVYLKGCDAGGYIKLSIKKAKYKYCFVHRLQAFQKYGMALYGDGMEVRHLNGNSLDNSYDNILIGTHSQNMQDIPAHIRLHKAMHATSFIRKYNKEEVRKYHKNNNNSYKITMAKFNISSKGTLHYVLNS